MADTLKSSGRRTKSNKINEPPYAWEMGITTLMSCHKKFVRIQFTSGRHRLGLGKLRNFADSVEEMNNSKSFFFYYFFRGSLTSVEPLFFARNPWRILHALFQPNSLCRVRTGSSYSMRASVHDSQRARAQILCTCKMHVLCCILELKFLYVTPKNTFAARVYSWCCRTANCGNKTRQAQLVSVGWFGAQAASFFFYLQHLLVRKWCILYY